MKAHVNGVTRDVADGTTVADLLRALALPGSGIAVAVDGEVVPRGEFATTGLCEGAVVEVLTAVQGG